MLMIRTNKCNIYFNARINATGILAYNLSANKINKRLEGENELDNIGKAITTANETWLLSHEK